MSWKCFFLGCRWKVEGGWFSHGELLLKSRCERCCSVKVEAV